MWVPLAVDLTPFGLPAGTVWMAKTNRSRENQKCLLSVGEMPVRYVRGELNSGVARMRLSIRTRYRVFHHEKKFPIQVVRDIINVRTAADTEDS